MATEQLETLGTEDAKWLGEYSQVHMNVFGTPLRVMDHGEGAHIWDVDGNEYLDFLAGIAVNALGYAHPKWVKAVSEQAAKAAAAKEYAARKGIVEEAAREENAPLSGVSDRPFCKGRNYDPDRYAPKSMEE